jgi:hypothetical protein
MNWKNLLEDEMAQMLIGLAIVITLIVLNA